MNLEPIMARTGGLDREQDWGTVLSVSEQKLLAFARVLFSGPHVVFLDRPGTSLSPEQVKQVLRLLSNSSIGYLTIGEATDQLDLYDAVLEIAEDGAWTWKELGP
jgi:putative ATP-binding cassette transporter